MEKAANSLKIVQDHPELEAIVADLELLVSFRDALDKISQHYATISSPDPSLWKAFARPILHLKPRLGVITESDYISMAKLAHRAQLWREGADYFEKAKQMHMREYDECKAKSSPWPENVASLCRLKLFDDVIRPYLEKNRPPLSAKDSRFIAYSFAQDDEKCFEALGVIQQNDVPSEGIIDTFNAYPKKKLNDRIRKAFLSRYFYKLGQEKQIDTLLNILRDIDQFDVKPAPLTHVKDYIKANEKDVRDMCVLGLASIADAWTKVEWGATSPHKKNRLIQILKRAYPVARVPMNSFGLALACVYERLVDESPRSEAKIEALAILDKITKDGSLTSELNKFAWRRWVKIHMKEFRAKNTSDSISANKSLNTAKQGYYSADVDDTTELNIPVDPAELDSSWYFNSIINFDMSFTPIFESAADMLPTESAGVKSNQESKPVSIAPVANSSSPSKAIIIGDIKITHVPGSKVIIDHAERLAEYRFEKQKIVSLEENYLSSDELSIPSLNLDIKVINSDSVSLGIKDFGFNITFNKNI